MRVNIFVFFRMELISIFFRVELIFFGVLLTAFRRPENSMSKIICLAFTKRSFRLIKPLESFSLQFHAVAFIARSTEGPEQFYLVCYKVIYTLYAAKCRDS